MGMMATSQLTVCIIQHSRGMKARVDQLALVCDQHVGMYLNTINYVFEKLFAVKPLLGWFGLHNSIIRHQKASVAPNELGIEVIVSMEYDKLFTALWKTP